jgi:hypothetical protein
MNPGESKSTQAQRKTLLGQINVAEAALRANLALDCAGVTARMHMQRALAHIQEAQVACNGVDHARTVWQLVEDITKFKRDLDEVPADSSVRHIIRPSR